MSQTQNLLDALYNIVLERRRNGDGERSYVARLAAKGRPKLAQKVGEEAVETVIAALGDDRQALISESADLIFHLEMLWADCGVQPGDVMAELSRRMGVSGLEEKAGRKEMSE